ncbi:MAG: ABC transporter permease [Victivallaceae bacterium]|nr:ABC transporter permease [Victivallaceae bacterium]
MKLPKILSQWSEQAGDAVLSHIATGRQFCTYTGMALESIWAGFRAPHRVKWNSIGIYVADCGTGAMPIIALLGFLIGVILAFQAIIQLGRYGVESYVVNLVGTVIVTELAPLVTAVVLAGRSGSAFAAEIGTMKASEELDAMQTMGFDFGRFLLLPKLVAMMLVMPGLTILCDVAGVLGGMSIVCSQLAISIPEYLSRSCEVIRPLDLTQGLIKSFVFALIVALVGCMKGFTADRDAQGVGRATTGAVVMAIFLVVISDAFLTACFSSLEKMI